jgi:hypothetical protein
MLNANLLNIKQTRGQNTFVEKGFGACFQKTDKRQMEVHRK